MANDEILTDDYVAELLAKDAKDSAIKYSSMGLDAFKQSKYVLPPQSTQNAGLIELGHQRISRSRTPVSYATLSRIPTAIMPHSSPRKLQSPAPACEVWGLMSIAKRKRVELVEEILENVSLGILQRSWEVNRGSEQGLEREEGV
jgi:hypothetical protein